MSKLSWGYVKRIALGELGYTETPAGSNRTKYGVWYGMNGVAWCAEYVSWCYRGDLTMIKGKFARTDEKARSLNKQGVFHKGSAGIKAGDIVFYAFYGSSFEGRYLGINHVGICLGEKEDGRIIAIEGNTSAGDNANGGQVQIRYRSKGYIAGYFRPAYVKTSSTKPSKPVSRPNPILRRGHKGAAVTRLQKALNASGAHLKVDGDFGRLTENAVKAFQKKHKLLTDGVVGPKTWAALLK